MIHGLYNGAAALDVIARQQELISANLANLNTSGYRRAQFVVAQRENPSPGGTAKELGPEVLEVQTDFQNGRLHPTGRALDASLVGDGFFSFQSPEGVVYSRGGRFFRDADSGTLINSEGHAVLGENGTIEVPDDVGDNAITIAEDGTVSAGGEELGKLAVTSFADNQTLIPLSQSVFRAGPQSVATESTASVTQFNQEFSNTNPVSEMIAMVIGMRQYEAVQKASTAMSESLREHIRA